MGEITRSTDITSGYPRRPATSTRTLLYENDQESYSLTAEGDIVVDDNEYSYAGLEFDLTVEEAFKLYNDLGQWLNRHGSS